MNLRGMLVRAFALATVSACIHVGAAADETEVRLLRQPSLSRDHLAFVYAGDIWVSDRNGQHPIRLTAHPANEYAPHFSPDGNWIAFSAAYDNNTDVYVIPVTGGQPRRLTWHPGEELVTGWSPDSKRVLFVSEREVANNRSGQFYEVPVEGGYERKIMKAVGVEGVWSSDGKRLAYRPYIMANSGINGWRQHRGGDTPPLWIIDPANDSVEKIPHVNASDWNPMWIGDDIAFISDRNDGAANLFLYDGHTHALRQLTHETVWDVRSASAYERTIVYEVGGVLKSIDVDGGQIQPIPIRLALQSIQARPQWKDAGQYVTSVKLSTTGKRVLVTARGDVFSVPVKDGSVRNLTATSGVRESDALWSNDGQHVAYLSDAGEVQALMVRDALGLEKPVRHALGHLADKPSYFTLLNWSPDGRRVVFQDNHLHLYAIELESNAVTLLDTSERRANFKTSFSPDGQWLAYTVVGENYLTRVRLYNFGSGHSAELADSLIQTDDPSSAAATCCTSRHPSMPARAARPWTCRRRSGHCERLFTRRYCRLTGTRPCRQRAATRSCRKNRSLQKDAGARQTQSAAGKGSPEHDKADETRTTGAGAIKPTRIDLAGLVGALRADPGAGAQLRRADRRRRRSSVLSRPCATRVDPGAAGAHRQRAERTESCTAILRRA